MSEEDGEEEKKKEWNGGHGWYHTCPHCGKRILILMDDSQEIEKAGGVE